jgi:hypothetical protein
MQGKQGGQPKSEHILDKSIDQASKEEIAQWLKTSFPSLSKLFLEKGFTGRNLVQLATTGTSVLEKLVPDDLVRLELIDVIDKQQKQGIFHPILHL